MENAVVTLSVIAALLVVTVAVLTVYVNRKRKGPRRGKPSAGGTFEGNAQE